MLNELDEFKSYTGNVRYQAKNKQDNGYLGRFTYEMLMKDYGLARVLTIIARGYLWENGTANLNRAWEALCAWCSIPDKKNTSPGKVGQSETDYRILHESYPELVAKSGEGWYLRHVKNVIRFVKNNSDLVSKTARDNCDKLGKGFKEHWRKKVMQFQVPIFSENTKGAWILRFDDILADALELGPLQNQDFELSDNMLHFLLDATPKGVPENVLPVLVKYYLANKQENTDWVVLPVTNFDAYFGTTAFGRRWITLLPKNIFDRSVSGYGISRYRIVCEEILQEYRESGDDGKKSEAIEKITD